MTKTFLTATVAALAIAAPAHADRGDKDERPQKAERAQPAQDGGQRAQRSEARPEPQQRQQRAERVRVERPQRQQRVEVQRPQRQERAQQRVQLDRPQRAERVRVERPQRAERVRVERPQRAERVRAERPQRAERVRVERPQRAERVRVERPQRSRIEQVQRREARAARPQDRIRQVREQREQRVEQQQVRVERRAGRDRLVERQTQQQQRLFERAAKSEQRFDRREARSEQRLQSRLAQRQFVQSKVGRPFERKREQSRDWYDDYAAQRYQALTSNTPGFTYDYNPDDGYLYQLDRDSRLVTGLFPVLGGAFSAGQPLPIGYDRYNVPYAYRDLYYDRPDQYYRYGDGAIYRVDPTTQLIQGVVALLTGQRFGVGQMLPAGYDVYNVPYAYRDDYYDTDDSWYRYADGYIYAVDPYTRRISRTIPLSYGNFAVGYPVPAYANYAGYGAYAGYPSYGVPYAYQGLYYDQPGYNYHYANNGIYQVNPLTQLITAVVALVTGTNLGVGQMLPAGYDAYNLPYAYRDRYYDTPEVSYRYGDGAIYQVDPRTRIVEQVIPVSHGGFAVGYPVPAGYPGYPVPAAYQDLYYAEPGYDYRYFDGGIYQIDPRTQMVLGIPALVTGADLGIGQALPVGYDTYNVPYAYRDRYVDTPDNWYRYADGYIYQVDPATRLISQVIDAIA